MITLNQDPAFLYYTGTTFTVEWYRDEFGRMKAKESYDALSENEQIRLDHIVKYLADNPIGTRLPKMLYNLEDAEDQIYAFKPKDHRFFNFMTVGRKVIIVSAYRKHSQQMTKKDLNLLKSAVQAKHSYLNRVKAGTYYEGHAQ